MSYAPTIFPEGRALHFYDSQQSLGWAYTRHTFEGFMQRARAHVSDDDPLAEAIDTRGEGPQWDLYMLYPPGVKWGSEAAPPLPTHWIRHTGRRFGDETSVYWRDTPDAPPQQGSLFEAMRKMVEDARPGKATTRGPTGLQVEVLGLADCPNTQATRLAVEKAVASLAIEAQVAYVDQDTLRNDDRRRGWPSPTILVDGRDLFGMAPSSETGSACRRYADGAPSVDDVIEALRSIDHP